MISTTATAGIARSQDGTAISYQTLGAGAGVIVLGGAWRSGCDYLPFARALSRSFAVHVVDRRGRGRSGPQGEDYDIRRELEDVFAVQAQTAAKIVFGHSYGGLIALEAARRTDALCNVIVYEPGVSVAGSMPLGWVAPYEELLGAGDRRGAFATMVRGAGGAPRVLERLPLWYVKLVLRLFIPARHWRQIDPLLETALAEHEQVGALDEPTADRFRAVAARTILLGGGKSRSHFTDTPFDALAAAISACSIDILPGLDHTAPGDKAGAIVAERVRHHLARQC